MTININRPTSSALQRVIIEFHKPSVLVTFYQDLIDLLPELTFNPSLFKLSNILTPLNVWTNTTATKCSSDTWRT